MNLDAPAIDVIYSIDQKIMPPIYGWVLDPNHTGSVRVDRQTRKGKYHYLVNRDSRDASPTRWIRVDVSLRLDSICHETSAIGDSFTEDT